MLVQKAYNKLRVHLMIYNNINDILTFTINETKFRHCHYNWVYMRRFVSGIRELCVSVKPDPQTAHLVFCRHKSQSKKKQKSCFFPTLGPNERYLKTIKRNKNING